MAFEADRLGRFPGGLRQIEDYLATDICPLANPTAPPPAAAHEIAEEAAAETPADQAPEYLAQRTPGA